MARKLAADVFVSPQRYEIAERFRAGTREEDLPAGVAEKIRNPAAWVEIEVEDVVDEPGEPVVETSEPVQPADPEPATSPSGLVEPPRGGRGSGEDAWRSFAASLGQTVADDATRDEIVDQLIEAGLIEPAPVEREG